ncbi:kelch-like protein 26 [Mya arenaria]|uniref:kelch-like protein 26 n=1 Tax=Mya arenaria TaxID=6604 RepID=UPI0022DFEF29|nr:kelch-like protein 26 [Mya arenaria]XP_052816236.1 kelch-like protein 26 [Mya arenaria]XP_052816237.1 kelch-like protein 26 [Mya arenaria]XP_052816239.1 kelch-like protein 26 [Mya arenaria]XP_052816240.1 kelch-like protein 26 [Mya arenaria]
MVRQTAVHVSGADPQVCFEVVDHGDMVLAGLTKLRDMKQLFDVVLVVENERLPAHRVVLASCSDYFRAMFTDGLLECQLDEIRLIGVTAAGMRALIDFAYSSRIDINEDNVEDVLCAANHVQLIPVVEACVNFLKSHLSLSCCVDLLNIAELFTLHDLKDFTYKYICKNLATFGVSSEFLQLSFSQLETLLDMDYPVNCSECDVLSFVIGWIVHHHGYTWNEIGKILDKINRLSVDHQDLPNIPNFCDFDRLCIENESFKLFASSLDLNQMSVNDKGLVPGLVNIRGFHESVVVCGGFKPGLGMSNSVQWYDGVSGKMQSLTTVPHVEQCNFGVSVMENKLFIVGGCYNDDQMEEIVHGFGFCYDPAKNVWKNIPPMNMERCRFYLGTVGSKLFAIGGDPSASMDTGDFAHCECFDLETQTWQEIAPLPGNRMEHAGTALDNCLYVSGGVQDSEGPVFNTFFKYDIETNMWLQLPSMLTARADHTMFAFQRNIYVIGGWFEDSVTHQRVMANTVDCFDLDKGQWMVIASFPSPRLFASYTLHGDKIVIIGGWLNGDCQMKCNTVEMLDLPSLIWGEGPESEGRGTTGGLEVWEHAACCLWVPMSVLDNQ